MNSTEHRWPSGLRRRTQDAMWQHSWVQIPLCAFFNFWNMEMAPYTTCTHLHNIKFLNGYFPAIWRLAPHGGAVTRPKNSHKPQRRVGFLRIQYNGVIQDTVKYLAVFLTRYIDLFLGWKSFYIFVMKILFITQ